MRAEAAIDNDFAMQLADIDWEQDFLEKTMKIFFSELDVMPIMHELVYIHELEGGADTGCKNVAIDFFQKEIISLRELSSFLDTNQKKIYYEIVLKELYYDFMGEFPSEIKNVFNDWKAHASLGETHTAAMCFFIGCSIFLSDDKDSKQLGEVLKKKKAFDLNVYNRDEACKKLVEKGTTLNKNLRKVIKHKK